MPISSQAFKAALAQWASGVTVVTTLHADQPVGLTVSSLSSVSLNPPLISICLDRKLFAPQAIVQRGQFAVSVLGAHQVERGLRFAGLIPNLTDRFAGVETFTAHTGCPILAETLAWLDCTVWATYDGGDHVIVVGEVQASGTHPEASRARVPVVYYQRQWRTTTPLDPTPAPETAGEARAVHKSTAPVTPASLLADLRALGVQPGMTLVVHSALSALGWVAGGPQAVVQALQAAVSPGGTLVMPAFSTHLTDPGHWQNPPVPEAWKPVVRAETPAFDEHLTPTRGMGAVVDCFRHLPGVRRSAHPHFSCVAWGQHAADITATHPLDEPFGPESPLGRVYALDGHVLLLGVTHANNSSLHLAERQAVWVGKKSAADGAPVLLNGERVWQAFFYATDWNADDFAQLGEDFARTTAAEQRGPVGHGVARLFRQRAAVDFAVTWLAAHRASPPA